MSNFCYPYFGAVFHLRYFQLLQWFMLNHDFPQKIANYKKKMMVGFFLFIYVVELLWLRIMSNIKFNVFEFIIFLSMLFHEPKYQRYGVGFFGC